MNTKLKIAAILCSMVLLCLASISQAHAYDASHGRGVIARIVAFANSLLEPAVFSAVAQTADDSSNAVPVTAQDELASSRGGGEAPASSAWMPFMSFERALDEAP